MGLYASRTEKEIEPIPQGLHHAICYTVADLGTQMNPVFNKEQRKAVFIWELPRLRIDIQRDGHSVNLPRVISQVFTVSLHEKSHLYNTLVSWRGKKFAEAELEKFDLFTVAGANCQLNITHNTNGGKTYANISAVVPLAKKEWLGAENPIVKYSIDEDGENYPETLPEWIVNKIKESKEMKTGNTAGSQAVPENYLDQIPEDEIPF